jgi:hypothetical protein
MRSNVIFIDAAKRRPTIVVTDKGRRFSVRIRWPGLTIERPYVEEFASARRALSSARRTARILDYPVVLMRDGGRP